MRIQIPALVKGESYASHQLLCSAESLAQNLRRRHTGLTKPEVYPGAGFHRATTRVCHLQILLARERADRAEGRSMEDLGNKLRLPVPAPDPARRVVAGC